MIHSISEQDAVEIVTQINSIMEQRVNIMNAEGIIVGSSDPDRVGTFHEGAYLIIRNRLEKLVIFSDEEYSGTKKGTNFPIIVEGEIIGVVGISGEYEGIEKYGQIIKTMTEILIRGKISEQERQRQETARARYLEEWLTGELKNINHAFVDRGISLGIDITVPRRLMGISIYDEELRTDAETSNRISQAEEYVSNRMQKLDPASVLYRSVSLLFCGVSDRPDADMQRLAQQLQKEVKEKYQLEMAVGIDTRGGNYLMAHQSYIQARKALEACTRTHNWKLRFYDDLNMEIFSEEIPAVAKQEFVRRVFKGYDNEEIAQLVQLLETFLDEEGSITRTADKLFMHKNTLQYKLRKIEERTGYDPRSIRHSSLYYIAIYFYREIRDTMLERPMPD